MNYVLVPQAVILFITAVISAAVAYTAWRRRVLSGGTPFFWSMSAVFLWTFGTAFENAAVEPSAKILWAQVEYVGLVNVTPLFLLFILEYTGKKRPGRRTLAALWTIPIITLLLAWTNAWHGLLWSGFSPGSRVANVLVFHHGLWFWVSTTYYYAMFTAINIILVRQFLKASQLYRRQLGAMMLASFFPALTGIIYIADLSFVPGLDWTPLGCTALGLVFVWNISRFQMLDLAPVARDKLIERLADGVIVLDAQERIVDINPAAHTILLNGNKAKTRPTAPKPGTPIDSIIGQPAVGALSTWPILVKHLHSLTEMGTEIILGKGPMRHVYELHVLPLVDRRGQISGRLATLHDITRRKKIEEAEREQRILAEALADTAAALNRSLDFDEVLDRILDNIEKVVPHDAAAVALVDEEGVAHFVRTTGFAERGLEPVILGLRLQVLRTENFQKMVKSGEPVIIPDTLKDKDWVQVEGTEWERSYAGVPIRTKGRVIGVLYLCSATPGFFNVDHGTRLQAFADQAAIAIENSRLYTETQRLLKETEALQAAGLAVNSTLDFNLVLDKIIDQLGRVLSFDTASVQLMQGEESIIVGARGFETPEEVIGLHYSVQDNLLFKQILKLGGPLYVADVQIEYAPLFQGPARFTRAWLGVPLFAQELPIGFMTLDSKEAGHFTPRDERLATMFASQVGIALQNSRLYMEAQRRIKEQSALNEIAQSISSKLEQNALLDVVYEQIQRFIDVQFFQTVVYDPENDEWKGIYWKYTLGTYCERSYKSSEGLTGFIIKSRKPLLLQNSQELDAFFEISGYENVGAKPRSFMGVPLVISNRVIGAMVTENFNHDNHYNQQDLSLFLTLASQVAVALENARLYAQMKELAITDSLTGLYNRRHLYTLASNEVERALRYKKPLAILMIDLDHFKLVNDAYGHAMGDQLLQVVTRQCSQALRKIDIMGRYGGEEFIILLPETGLKEAQRAANRLCELIAATEIPSSSGPVKVTASLGLVALNKSLATLEVLLDCADKALYEAKEAGRNQVKIYTH